MSMQLSEWEEIFRLNFTGLWPWFTEASRLREEHNGTGVSLCVILNAKSGLCQQDCAFCAQSRRSQAPIQKYPLLPQEELVAAAQQAAAQGAARFSIVTSGRGVMSPAEQETILGAVAAIRRTTKVQVCVSLGILAADFLRALAAAGVHRYHHNVETAASFFPEVATAHSYEERLATIRQAQAAGLAVCVGGIFGLGESVAQRFEMAQTIKELEVDSIPLNFLQPIPGTPMAERALTATFGSPADHPGLPPVFPGQAAYYRRGPGRGPALSGAADVCGRSRRPDDRRLSHHQRAIAGPRPGDAG